MNWADLVCLGVAMPASRLAARLLLLLAAAPAAAEEATVTVPAAVLAMHERAVANGECVPLETLLQWYKPTAGALSDADTLYIVPCDQGVFNSPFKLYVVSTGDTVEVRELAFAQFDPDFGWIGDTVQFNPAYDPATRTLTARQSYTAFGDCGTAGTWIWRKFAFAMTEYRLQKDCDGSHPYGTWPVIWKVGAGTLERSLDNRSQKQDDLYFYQVPP
jgi:hypothetical protein